MKKHNYQIYIGTNSPRHTVLYTGVTNNVFIRNDQHKNIVNKYSFTAMRNVNKIVHYEISPNIIAAIEREKQIKSWSRKKKIKLIESINPGWKNLIEKSLN